MTETGPQGLPDPGATGQEGQVADENSLASGFLQNIPEVDRNVVEKYVKDWDANYTRSVQKVHEKYKPYTELGELDELKTAREVVELLNNNPQHVFNILAEQLGVELPKPGEKPPAGTQPSSTVPPVGETQELQGIPKELQEKLEKQEKLLQQLATTYVSEQTARQQAEQDAALDKYLGELKTKYGEYDERYVLLLMNEGKSGDEAVKEFQTKFGPPKPATPPPLSGGGTLPGNTQSVEQLSQKDTVDLVASYLKGAKQ